MAHKITLKKLGERAQRIVNAGVSKPELKVDVRDAMLSVAQARDEALLQLFYDKKATGDHTFPFDILSEFTLTVEDKKVTLPKRGLSILKHNSGIYRVVTSGCGEEEELLPTPYGFNTLYKNQPSIGLEGRPSYVPFQDQLRVKGVEDGCKLLVTMVVAGEEFDEDEFFCIPPELENSVVRNAIENLTVMVNAQEDATTNARGDS